MSILCIRIFFNVSHNLNVVKLNHDVHPDGGGVKVFHPKFLSGFVYIAGDTEGWQSTWWTKQYLDVCGRVQVCMRIMDLHCQNAFVVMTCVFKEVDLKITLHVKGG